MTVTEFTEPELTHSLAHYYMMNRRISADTNNPEKKLNKRWKTTTIIIHTNVNTPLNITTSYTGFNKLTVSQDEAQVTREITPVYLTDSRTHKINTNTLRGSIPVSEGESFRLRVTSQSSTVVKRLTIFWRRGLGKNNFILGNNTIHISYQAL